MKRYLITALLSGLVASQPVVASEDLGREVIQQLHRVSSDVSRPHQFDFYLYLPNETAASEACAKIRAKGLVVQVRAAAKGKEWLCLASLTAVPNVSSLSSLGTFFESIARENDGEFDGWEASVVR